MTGIMRALKMYVIVRTFSAGVHCGELLQREGKEVTLSNARRIWYWRGAFTLHELSIHGPGPGSKLSETIPEITLTEAIEVIPCAPAAATALVEFMAFTP